MPENGHEIWFFYISYYTLKKNNDIIDVLKNRMEYYM